MSGLKKVKIFLSLDIQTKLILLEAFVFLGWARLLKSIPFSKIAPSFGEQMEETSFYVKESHKKGLGQVSRAIEIMSRNTIWESMCLVKAIAAMKMLERRGIESTLYLGTAKDKAGKMIAHAWLRSGPFFITGAEEKDDFVVVGKFARNISHPHAGGDENGE